MTHDPARPGHGRGRGRPATRLVFEPALTVDVGRRRDPTVARCPVCGAHAARTFLSRRDVPVHQNLVVADETGARAVRRGDLTLAACERCGFVHNRTFDESLLSYGPDYDNTQTFSPAFASHIDGVVRYLLDSGIDRGTVVEVGCGKGGFLRELCAAAPGLRAIGFDPAYVGPEHELGGRLRFERRRYDGGAAQTRADAVVCRHVIEHVADPLALLGDVRAALAAAPAARVFFETPCVRWILENRVVWDLFYEHTSLFDAASLGLAFRVAGLSPARVRHVFGGQYLLLEASVAPLPSETGASAVDPRAAASPGSDVAVLAQRFARDERARIAALRRRLAEAARRGRVAVWGAGAKGATLLSLADPDAELVDCVVDQNPKKQGRFLPGTAHAIVGPDDLARRDVRTAFVTNSNYTAEIARRLVELGLYIDLVELDEPARGAAPPLEHPPASHP